MYIPLRGCCTDSPGLDDIATARQVYLTLSLLFAAAAALVLGIHLFLR